jgi:arsenite methyltransferase
MSTASSVYFQQNARQWDSLRAGYFGEKVRRAAIAKAHLRPEMTVADVGAGTGFLSAGLAPMVAKVILVDASSEMIEVAKTNLAGYNNLEFHVADGLELPLPANSVDAVFANMYLHHCPDPLAALREMARILKPGGRLVVTDLRSHPYTWLKEEMADVWLGFADAQIQAWLKESGLVNRVVQGSGCSCCAESQKTEVTGPGGQRAEIDIFVAVGSKRIPAREAVQEHYAAIADQAPGRGCGCSSTEPSSAGCESTATVIASACCSSSSNANACCGNASQDPFMPEYSAEERNAAPADAEQISLGCGNPTALAALQPGETVLDIGSGGGLDAFLSARKVGPTGRVVGVDMTPGMLNRARATAAKNDYTNVEFRQGQAEALPVENASVDVVLSNCVINLSEDKGQVFAEAFRVLKPGGRLEVSDILASGSFSMEERLNSQGWAECLTGAIPEQEYVDLIQQAGFQDISVRRSAAETTAGGVQVFSARVSARKGSVASCCSG